MYCAKCDAMDMPGKFCSECGSELKNLPTSLSNYVRKFWGSEADGQIALEIAENIETHPEKFVKHCMVSMKLLEKTPLSYYVAGQMLEEKHLEGGSVDSAGACYLEIVTILRDEVLDSTLSPLLEQLGSNLFSNQLLDTVDLPVKIFIKDVIIVGLFGTLCMKETLGKSAIFMLMPAILMVSNGDQTMIKRWFPGFGEI